jgi:hypothetical protein
LKIEKSKIHKSKNAKGHIDIHWERKGTRSPLEAQKNAALQKL